MTDATGAGSLDGQRTCAGLGRTDGCNALVNLVFFDWNTTRLPLFTNARTAARLVPPIDPTGPGPREHVTAAIMAFDDKPDLLAVAR